MKGYGLRIYFDGDLLRDEYDNFYDNIGDARADKIAWEEEDDGYEVEIVECEI